MMKYNNTPRISILVVTNGPVAIAGSTSSFFKISGIVDPTVTAIIIDEQILNPTTRPRSGSALINLNLHLRLKDRWFI